MKALLNDLSQQSGHEEILLLIANDMFVKTIKICKTAARYGNKYVTIDVMMLKPFKWIPNGCSERVIQHLCGKLAHENILQSVNGMVLMLKWTLLPNEETIPRVTTRDLIELGFTDTNTYGNILKQLKTAIANGEVSSDTQQAQLIWIKKRFSRN